MPPSEHSERQDNVQSDSKSIHGWGQSRRRVGRREVDHTVGGDLVDDGQRNTRGCRADDRLNALGQVRVDGLAGDIRGGVARVTLDVGDRATEDSASSVDLRDGLLNTSELGRPEERKVTGSRQHRSNDQGVGLASGFFFYFLSRGLLGSLLFRSLFLRGFLGCSLFSSRLCRSSLVVTAAASSECEGGSAEHSDGLEGHSALHAVLLGHHLLTFARGSRSFRFHRWFLHLVPD